MNLGKPVGEIEITPAELNAADLEDALADVPLPLPEPDPIPVS
ncbi:MAG: hypothetical protein QOG87_260 [Actinomycetota bacterium]|jgi:hypothetical protein